MKTDQAIADIVLNVAQEAVDAAFSGRFISGSKDPTTERHVTRDQLFRIVLEAVVAGVKKARS
jgi:hypothetical protein